MWKRGWLFGLAVVAGLIVAACSGGGVSEDRVAVLEAESLDDLLDRERDLIAEHIEALEHRLTERLQSRRN